MEELARVSDELSRQVERITREDQVGIQAVLFAGGLAMILVAIFGTAVTKNPAFVVLVVASALAIVLSKEVVNKIPGTVPAPSIGPLIQAAAPADAPQGAPIGTGRIRE